MSIAVRTLLAVLASLPLVAAGCRSPYYADRGAAFGGLTGAAVGAAIGEHNHNPLAGAIIGGAVGTMTGAAVGDVIDADIARNDAIIQQQLGRRLAGAVTMNDVVSMTHANLSEDVIITHIRANGVAQPPTVEDMIALKQQGVSDRIINALQSQPPIQATAAQGPPVIVRERYVGPPPPFYWGPPRWGCYPHHHRTGFHWGVTVGR